MSLLSISNRLVNLCLYDPDVHKMGMLDRRQKLEYHLIGRLNADVQRFDFGSLARFCRDLGIRLGRRRKSGKAKDLIFRLWVTLATVLDELLLPRAALACRTNRSSKKLFLLAGKSSKLRGIRRHSRSSQVVTPESTWQRCRTQSGRHRIVATGAT